MNKLQYLRGMRGWTVRELGEKSGVAYATISRLETGKQKAYATTLGKLARALEVDLTELAELLENTALKEEETAKAEPKQLAQVA